MNNKIQLIQQDKEMCSLLLKVLYHFDYVITERYDELIQEHLISSLEELMLTHYPLGIAVSYNILRDNDETVMQFGLDTLDASKDRPDEFTIDILSCFSNIKFRSRYPIFLLDLVLYHKYVDQFCDFKLIIESKIDVMIAEILRMKINKIKSYIDDNSTVMRELSKNVNAINIVSSKVNDYLFRTKYSSEDTAVDDKLEDEIDEDDLTSSPEAMQASADNDEEDWRDESWHNRNTL